MNVTLVAINAKYIHTNNAIRLLKANSAFPLTFFDFTIKDSHEFIVETILKSKPTLLGFSCYIWNIEIISTLIPMLRKHTDIPIILGGPEVSYDPFHFLDSLDIAAVIKGEGEHVIDTLIDALHNNKSLASIPNISAYEEGKRINNPLTEIKDLQSLTMPYYFTEDKDALKNKIAYIEASRGCPYKCSYCLSSLEKTVRFFPFSTVTDSIDYLQTQGAKTFKFLDRTFNANKTMLDLIDYIIDNHKEGTVFQFEITGDTLDPKIVDAIHEKAPKNLFRFEIGIQSTNEETNRLVDRKQNNEKLFSIINKIEDAGIIDLHLDLIAGLPKEDLASFKETFNSVYSLGSKELQLGFLKMLRGTKIRYQASLYGYKYEESAPYEIIENNSLSSNDIQIIKDVETMLNLLHNKEYFNSLIYTFITNENIQAFDWFYAMYHRYREENLPLKRYQIETLYAFMDAYFKANQYPSYRDQLLTTYLQRAKVKPKGYTPFIKDKTIKNHLFDTLTKETNIPVNTWFKHSVVCEKEKGYIVALYQNQKAHLYHI